MLQPLNIAFPASTARVGRTFALLSASLMLGACSGGLGTLDTPNQLAAAPPSSENGPGAASQSELEKATDYWGKEYAKNPRNLDAAISYAKNLKAMGQKGQALSVMQQASLYHGRNRKLASEYGRLALELDQVSVAAPLLELADDPATPDWKVISARGTVLAKQGRYKEAIPVYERALTLAHDQPSVVNNLAMAYAMSGEAARAEQLLRKAAASDNNNAKVRQNLALVLSLQGKHDDARALGAGTPGAETVAYNADLMQKIVRVDTKPAATAVQTAKAKAPAGATQARGSTPALKPATTETARADEPAKLADATGEPMFKPSKR